LVTRLADESLRTGEYIIRRAVRVERVRVTETSSSWAEYSQ
jgi:hypothetical protein